MTVPVSTPWDRAVRTARSTRPAPAAVRLLVLLAGAVLTLTPTPTSAPGLVFTGVGVVLAAAFPAQVGASIATVGFVLAWLGAYGLHGQPEIARTAVAAAVLFAVHQGCALAAMLPLDSRVDPGVLGAWAVRCVPPLLVAAGAGAIDLLLPRRSGTPLAELLGLAAAVAVVTAGLWWALAPVAVTASLPRWLPLPQALLTRIERVGRPPRKDADAPNRPR